MGAGDDFSNQNWESSTSTIHFAFHVCYPPLFHDVPVFTGYFLSFFPDQRANLTPCHKLGVPFGHSPKWGLMEFSASPSPRKHPLRLDIYGNIELHPFGKESPNTFISRDTKLSLHSVYCLRACSLFTFSAFGALERLIYQAVIVIRVFLPHSHCIVLK